MNLKLSERYVRGTSTRMIISLKKREVLGDFELIATPFLVVVTNE